MLDLLFHNIHVFHLYIFLVNPYSVPAKSYSVLVQHVNNILSIVAFFFKIIFLLSFLLHRSEI